MIVIDKQPRLEHKVVIHTTSSIAVEKMCEWCHTKFGKRFAVVDRVDFGLDGTWQCTWGGADVASFTFQFDHSKDAVLFALRWA